MPESNPWKRLSSRLIYENPWISVREDAVIRPDGKEGIYGVVDTRIATGVVPMTEDNCVVLVGQYRYPIDQYSWEIPEGGTEGDELPLECIKRELQEEAGYTSESWVQLGEEFHLSNCFSSEVGYVFLARDLKPVPVSPDGTEVLQVKKVPFEDCIDMVYSGKIKDSVSIIGILRAQQYIADNS